MKFRHRQRFETFSEKAIDIVINSAVDKPFKDSEGEVIGVIVEANRTDEDKVLEFIIEIDDKELLQ